MNIIHVSGISSKRALSEFLQEGFPGSWLIALEDETGDTTEIDGEELSGSIADSGLAEDAPLVLETDAFATRLAPAFAVLVADGPPAREEGLPRADVVIVETGSRASGEWEIGLERAFKKATGAGKVLLAGDEEGVQKAYRKVLDMAAARIGGRRMPEEIPEKVTETLKAEATDGKISCDRAHELALELGVPVQVIGRALDLLGIKITRCQLGCF